MNEECTDLAQFIRGEVDPGSFPHREHVRMGFEMLRRHNFEEAALHYCGALRAMTARAGKPMAFHQTITIAFLALIAERMEAAGHSAFTSFASANPDLIDKSALKRWYRPERLATDAARRTFLLPDPHSTGDRP
jgi:hypothetical protein